MLQVFLRRADKAIIFISEFSARVPVHLGAIFMHLPPVHILNWLAESRLVHRGKRRGAFRCIYLNSAVVFGAGP